jgi:glycerol uptake facilitator-like aquaporin
VIRRLAAEALGTALLLAIVVGSGIMGEKLAAGNTAVALLANSVATGAGLFVLIATFGLILTIRLSARAPLPQLAAAVALWITAAYWFTSSTSFANPARSGAAP